MFVTAELLKNLKACKSQRNRFAELFPQGVELTRELIVQYAQEFSWTWCADNLATKKSQDVYYRTTKKSWAVYDRAENAAHATCLQAIEQVYDTWQQAGELQYTVYQQAIIPARAAYLQAKEQAKAAYNLACATAFADIMGL